MIEIEDGIERKPPVIGRRRDKRLAALDEEMVQAIDEGRYSSDREAAKQNVERYAQRQFADYEKDARDDKIRAVQKRIQRQRQKT